MTFSIQESKPDKEKCSYIGSFGVAGPGGAYVGRFARYTPHLTDDRLWLSPDLCIPVATIQNLAWIKSGILLPCVALQIEFRHSVSGLADTVQLCDVSMLGFYRQNRLKDLKNAIESARSRLSEEGVSPNQTPDMQRPRPAPHPRTPGMFRSLFGSTRSLKKSILHDMAAAQDPDCSTESMTDEELHAQVATVVSADDFSSDDLEQHLSKSVLVLRLYAAWKSVWIVFVPLGLTSYWLFRNPPEKWNFASIMITALLFAVGFFVTSSLGGIILAILQYPFTWITNAVFGLKVQRVPGRRY